MNSNFITYQDASDWAKTNNVKTKKEWGDLKNRRPKNIPYAPHLIYKDEWRGWSVFLQHRTSGSRPSATYQECQEWAQKNCIQTAKQWYSLKEKRPLNMPTAPDRFFKGQWTNWFDFLGVNKFSGISVIERVTRLVLDSVFAPESEEHRKQSTTGFSGKIWNVDMLYSELCLIFEYDGQFYHMDKEDVDRLKTKDLEDAGWKVIRIREGKLKLLNKQWDINVKKSHYEENKVKVILRHVLSLHKSGAFSLNDNQYGTLVTLIDNLDLFPFYQKMGVYNEFVSYDECKAWALNHNITGEAQWRTFKEKRRGTQIPNNPERVYKNNGWVNWPTFLGNGQRSKKESWATYEEASQWGQENKIKGAKEWYRLGDRRPSNMPTSPETTYKNQWVSWPEFLKNGKRSVGSFASYEEASLWAKNNNIKTGIQWVAFKNKPHNIPSYPRNVYIEQWMGWASFLGVEPYRGITLISKPLVRKRVTERKFNFVSYEECAAWAKNNGVKTSKDWKKIKNRPSNIPSDPPMAYKKVWVSWPEFLKM